MSKSNYVSHNKSILNAVAGEQHKKWLKENHRRALKKAKQSAIPMTGITFKDLRKLKALIA